MLDRVRSRDKEKVQFVLEREMIRDIRKAAADAYQTQSKFIADLVVVALAEAEALDSACDRLVLTLVKQGYDLAWIHSKVEQEYEKQHGVKAEK